MKLTTKLLLGATVIAGLSISTFAACASDVDFGSTDGTNGKNITGLKDPVNPQDAVTKAYVDGTLLAGTVDAKFSGAVYAKKYTNGLVCFYFNNLILTDANISHGDPIVSFGENISPGHRGSKVIHSLHGSDSTWVYADMNSDMLRAGVLYNTMTIGERYYDDFCW